MFVNGVSQAEARWLIGLGRPSRIGRYQPRASGMHGSRVILKKQMEVLQGQTNVFLVTFHISQP